MPLAGTLCVDVGNTNTVFGVIDNDGRVREQWRIATESSRMPDEYAVTILTLLHHAGVEAEDIEGMAISSVVPSLTTDFVRLGRRYLKTEALVVGPGIDTGLRVLYDDPRQVGADRIVNCVSVKERFGGPACVVDFGTATTFDALDREGNYLGGAIAPGIVIAAEALFARAARLVKVDIRRPPAAVGRNTEHSIQAGLLFGYVSLVEGLVARFRQELGEDMKVIGTGGLADVVAAETDVFDVVDPTLTLDGLYRIYRRNRGR
ncbi:MAG: type III pantothenate kinase [Anaerolineae bacterium]|nr:type III pantothenate kinase [Anaerolineae bacterium]